MYKIILEQDLETDYGIIHKGAELESTMHDDENEIIRYIKGKYMLEGIKVTYKKI